VGLVLPRSCGYLLGVDIELTNAPGGDFDSIRP
jgi:hypothetical protein